jgi:hypothetical protein
VELALLLIVVLLLVSWRSHAARQERAKAAQRLAEEQKAAEKVRWKAFRLLRMLRDKTDSLGPRGGYKYGLLATVVERVLEKTEASKDPSAHSDLYEEALALTRLRLELGAEAWLAKPGIAIDAIHLDRRAKEELSGYTSIEPELDALRPHERKARLLLERLEGAPWFAAPIDGWHPTPEEGLRQDSLLIDAVVRRDAEALLQRTEAKLEDLQEALAHLHPPVEWPDYWERDIRKRSSQ